jgi:hypothetical protein
MIRGVVSRALSQTLNPMDCETLRCDRRVRLFGTPVQGAGAGSGPGNSRKSCLRAAVDIANTSSLNVYLLYYRFRAYTLWISREKGYLQALSHVQISLGTLKNSTLFCSSRVWGAIEQFNTYRFLFIRFILFK